MALTSGKRSPLSSSLCIDELVQCFVFSYIGKQENIKYERPLPANFSEQNSLWKGISHSLKSSAEFCLSSCDVTFLQRQNSVKGWTPARDVGNFLLLRWHMWYSWTKIIADELSQLSHSAGQERLSPQIFLLSFLWAFVSYYLVVGGIQKKNILKV